MNITNQRVLFPNLIVALAAFIFPFMTGFLGIMPLDQSIIFEAAGRIVRGEKLFTDFYLPYALVPVLIQSVFFKLFGINWMSYVLHAAVFNGIFAPVIYDLLKLIIQKAKISYLMLSTIAISWAYYPMMGTPFMDNHSFFFGLLSYWFCVRAFKTNRYYFLIFCFPLLVIGYYCKPLPATCWFFPLLLELYLHKNQSRRNLNWLIGGFLLAVLAALLPFLFFNVQTFLYYTFLLPSKVGQARVGKWAAGNLVHSVINSYKIWVPAMLPLLIFISNKKSRKDTGYRSIFLSILLFLAVTIFSAGITLNSFYNITTPVFLFSFFVFHQLNMEDPSSEKKQFYKLVFWGSLGVLLLFISMINMRRIVQDMDFKTADLKKYSPELGVYLKTPGDIYSSPDITKLFKIFKENNCLYIGDLQLLYSLSKKDNPWPFVHIHDGTSYNSRDPKAYADIKLKLLERLKKLNSSLVVQDTLWYQNEAIVSWLQEIKGDLKDSFGNIQVYQLDQLALDRMLNALNKNLEN